MFVWVLVLFNFRQIRSVCFSFTKDYQLYAQIARDYPLIKSDNSSSESSDDDTLFTIDHLVQLNIQEYL